MPRSNPYVGEIEQVLPRILALFNTDPLDPMKGVGDRFHWGWKLIDFPNGTFQGAVHGLAQLLRADALPLGLDREHLRRRIDDIFAGTARITRTNGSLEEAFPYEGSFCVTALVAYDLLTALELLSTDETTSNKDAALEVVAPLVRFVCRTDETHGLISNHLATAVAALVKWDQLTGDKIARRRAEHLLSRILDHQSEEGWFSEYGGADPGYQSQCTGYLAEISAVSDEPRLYGALQRSVRFLWHFAHPDGSFGGLYGCRNTRFYHPDGVEALADRMPEAAALAAQMRQSIARQTTVTVTALDEPNLIPMFNSYCRASAQYDRRGKSLPEEAQPILPAARETPFQQYFPGAGLLVDSGPRHYTVISTHKGGGVSHFRKDNSAGLIDAGVVLRDRQGRYYTGQIHEPSTAAQLSEDGRTLVVQATMRRLAHPMPTPLRFLVLRALNVTVMRVSFVSALIKKLLVNYLVRPHLRSIGTCRREIKLGPDLEIVDSWDGPDAYQLFVPDSPFAAIHMASRGYWQIQDDAAGGTTSRAESQEDIAGEVQ